MTSPRHTTALVGFNKPSIWIVFVFSILLTAFAALLVQPFSPDPACCDHLFYRSMAFNLITVSKPAYNLPPQGNDLNRHYLLVETSQSRLPGIEFLDRRNGLNRQPPYAYRIVTPLLARVFYAVTGDINASFYAVTFVGLSGAMFFLAVAVLGVTRTLFRALIAASILAAGPPTRVLLRNYMLVDPLSYLFIGLAVLALVIRRRWLFFAACLFGVFNKETLLPMLLGYPALELLEERRVSRVSATLAVGIALAWTLFRSWFPVPVDRYSVTLQLDPSSSVQAYPRPWS